MRSRVLKTVVTILILTVFIFGAGCQATRAPLKMDVPSVAEKELGQSVIIAYNQSETYALCRQVASDSHAARTYKFIVIRASDVHVVYRGSFRLGYVKWVSDGKIEVQDRRQIASDAKSASEIKTITINTEQ
jgi:hypothetical protein